MPYVKQTTNPHIAAIAILADQLALEINNAQVYEDAHSGCPDDSGIINYTISTLIDRYFRYNAFSYSMINKWLGALQGVSLEFYRRISVYEDRKLSENGDVYKYTIPKMYGRTSTTDMSVSTLQSAVQAN